jgi:hypothetical protein
LTAADLELLALRLAASGHVSGCLREWPYLVSAFERRGWRVPLDLGVPGMRELARHALEGA